MLLNYTKIIFFKMKEKCLFFQNNKYLNKMKVDEQDNLSIW